MSTVLGLILFVVYIAAVIGAAAAITWVVVRFSSQRRARAASSGEAG